MKKGLSAWMFGFILITFDGGHIGLLAQEPLPAVITRAPVFITPRQLEFLNAIYDTYSTGNSVKEDGCLDFEGGLQSALNYLQLKLGSKYDDKHFFTGFDLTFASRVTQADPPGVDDEVYAKKGSVGTRSGDDIQQLYGHKPWISAAVQSRDCHSVIGGSAVHRVEVFDYSAIAYIRPYNIQWLSWGGNMYYIITYYPIYNSPHQLQSSDDLKELELNLPMTKSFFKEIKKEYKRVGGFANLSFKIIHDSWGLTYNLNTYAKNRFEAEWDQSLKKNAFNLISSAVFDADVPFALYIANPFKKEISVDVNYKIEIKNRPAKLSMGYGYLHIYPIKYKRSIEESVGELFEHILELMDAGASEIDLKREFGGESIETTSKISGSKILKSNDDNILFLFVCSNRTDANVDVGDPIFSSRTSSDVSASSTLKIDISGLREE
ncbi:MAG: hypothetical protein ACYS0I_15185 [Planctomycetota bacterium]|jgi:hypothetical protein